MRIAGYDIEEFTHQAVAALIASGAVDAGMGARAVTDRFGLGFLPIGEETYFLATRASAAAPQIERLIRLSQEQSGAATGYASVRQSGEVES